MLNLFFVWFSLPASAADTCQAGLFLIVASWLRRQTRFDVWWRFAGEPCSPEIPCPGDRGWLHPPAPRLHRRRTSLPYQSMTFLSRAPGTGPRSHRCDASGSRLNARFPDQEPERPRRREVRWCVRKLLQWLQSYDASCLYRFDVRMYIRDARAAKNPDCD